MRAQHPARHARTILECTAAGDRPGKTEPPASAQSLLSSSQPPQDCCKEKELRTVRHLALHSACSLKQVTSFLRGTSALCVVNRGASLQ